MVKELWERSNCSVGCTCTERLCCPMSQLDTTSSVYLLFDVYQAFLQCFKHSSRHSTVSCGEAHFRFILVDPNYVQDHHLDVKNASDRIICRPMYRVQCACRSEKLSHD